MGRVMTGTEGRGMQSILDEMAAAEAKYGPFTSTHEALGVITEEFWELVRAIQMNYCGDIQNEAIQLAAACARLANQCGDHCSPFFERSGL